MSGFPPLKNTFSSSWTILQLKQIYAGCIIQGSNNH
jgi:hypothetical protein